MVIEKNQLSEFDKEIEIETERLKKIDKYKKEHKKDETTEKGVRGKDKEKRQEGSGKTTGKNEPFLADSGGFCLHESKSTNNVIDWNTGKLIEAYTNGVKLNL